MNKGRRTANARQIAELIIISIIFVTGMFFFGAGTYASVQSIINSCAFFCTRLSFWALGRLCTDTSSTRRRCRRCQDAL